MKVTAGRLQLDREAFLARYWQREPLLIREAIPAFKPPLDAAELAGLALEA
ncbi:MAG TPA: cupin domain-containing protein, partial [Myxococcota bacterium]|nr:cupin domain-containing protein [Myxococcota bacterium]